MSETFSEQIGDQRKVTMRSIRLLPDGSTATEEAVDHVAVVHLDAYVADARTRWQLVEVSDAPDAGVTGPEGTYAVPATLAVPDAGVVYNEGYDETLDLPPTQENPPEEPTMLLADWSTQLKDCPDPSVDLAGFLSWHKTKFAGEMVANTAMRNTLADAYKGAATYADLYSTSGAAAAGTAISGGSPAYASKLLSWGASSGGVTSTTATVFDIPSGATVAGFGVKTGAAGAYLDGGALTSQAFASQGTYTLTLTYTQT